jgi:hypothetical protein
MRDRTKEVELLKNQIEELQQATGMSNNNTYTPDGPSSPASTSAGLDGASSLPVAMTDQDWMGCSYQGTVQPEQQHDMLGACLDWTSGLDHGFGVDDEMNADSGSASTPASSSASAGPGPLNLNNLVPISPDSHAMHWQPAAAAAAAAVFPSAGVEDSMGMDYLPPSPPLQASGFGRARTGSGTTHPFRPTLYAPDAGEPIIHLAIARGNIDTLRLLLQDCHVSVNVRDRAGYTPLQRAVISGRTDMVALLIKHGADPS